MSDNTDMPLDASRTAEEESVAYWLQQLPEPHRSMALANLQPHDWKRSELEPVTKLSWALLGAFGWDTSPQGHQYWNEVYATVKAEEAQGKRS